jgi:hypothetical protein
VQGALLVQVVGDVEEHLLAAPRPQRRPEVRAVDAPRRALLVAAQVGVALLEGEVEDPASLVVDLRLGQGRDRQLPVEVHLTDGVDAGGDVGVAEPRPERDHRQHEDGHGDQRPLHPVAHPTILTVHM